MESLKDKHKDQTAWIIGKGPSLQYLEKKDIGEGPVIALNQAIIAIEALGLQNPIYSLQKDGGNRRQDKLDRLFPDCDFSGDCGDQCGQTVRPKKGTLLLHDLESKWCYPDYLPRFILSLKELGLQKNTFSTIFAIKASQYMGCNKINFVSCDAHVTGNDGCYVPGQGIITQPDYSYFNQRQELAEFILEKNLDCEWITPGGAVNFVKIGDLKFSFGVMTNDAYRLNTVLKKSSLPGRLHYLINPESATKGLNRLLDIIEKDGSDVAILPHHDMYFRQGWLEQVKNQIAKLPDSWVCAGIIGKDMNGLMCGKLHDMRIVNNIDTGFIHKFPQPASCFDECVIIINMKKGFRFDESLDGFDLYGTLTVLQTWEMGGTAWIVDAWAEHYCMRLFSWQPDEAFKKRYKMLHDRFQDFEADSTVFVNKPRFETSAA